jgi:hypothetical protein
MAKVRQKSEQSSYEERFKCLYLTQFRQIAVNAEAFYEIIVFLNDGGIMFFWGEWICIGFVSMRFIVLHINVTVLKFESTMPDDLGTD